MTEIEWKVLHLYKLVLKVSIKKLYVNIDSDKHKVPPLDVTENVQ